MNFYQLMEVEIAKAREQHPQNMRSVHEALAIILEEFEEFKTECFKKELSYEKVLEELVSVATMCQRMYEDILICEK